MQPVLAIESGIKKSNFYHHVSGTQTQVNIMQIWEDRKSAKNEALILYLENEIIPAPPIQPPKADPVQPLTVRVF